MFDENTFCTGSTFVPKQFATEEDDGWIINFVYNEDTNISQVHVETYKDQLSFFFIFQFFLFYSKIGMLLNFAGFRNRHKQVLRRASCKNYIATPSSVWIPWSFHTNFSGVVS